MILRIEIVWALALSACVAGGPGGDGGPVECTSESDCPQGSVCRDTKCAILCSDNTQCPDDQYCDISVCRDVSSIIGCGNARLEAPEDCDDGKLNSDAWSVAEHCDADCTGPGPYCGDGALHPAELCDGNCPAACSDPDACTFDSLEGTAATCDAECVFIPIVICNDNDGCCPGTCDWWADNDCPPEPAFLGRVVRFDSVSEQPDADVTVSVTAVDWDADRDGDVDADDAALLVSQPTASNGDYVVNGSIPAGQSILVQTVLQQLAGDDGIAFDVPPSILARSMHSDATWQITTLDPPVVKFSWLARTAFECGLYASFDEAAGAVSINPDFIGTSSIVGRLVDDSGNPVSGIHKTAISIELDQDTADTLPGFLNADLTYVCFLDESGAQLVGAPGQMTSTASGAFVAFRLTRSETLNIGAGTATVRAIDYGAGVAFEPATLPLSASQIGVVTLRTTASAPSAAAGIDFATQVLPIFTNRGCVACHTGLGVGASLLRPDEVQPATLWPAIWEGTADEVYPRLTGVGRTCGARCEYDVAYDYSDPANNTYPRICVDAVDCSLLVARPQMIGGIHPLQAFTTPDDVDLVTIRQWIQQGARRYARVDFAGDIQPMLVAAGCTSACHDTGMPGGDVDRGGYLAIFTGDPLTAWGNIVGPGTTCRRVAESSPTFPRVCEDEPLRSLLIHRFLDDHDSGGASTAFVPPDLGDAPANALGTLLLWLAEGANATGS